MKMLVQSVVSLAFLCSTPHFLSAQLVPRSANTWAYFSHIADGGGWQTIFTISNPNRNPVSGRIFFQDPEGQDLYLDLKGYGLSGSVEFEIPALGTVEFTSSAASPAVRVGWATLLASNSVQGVATYSALENGSPRYSISVPASLPTIHYFSAATPGLGLAVGNIYSSEVSIVIRAESNNGSSFHGNMTLPAHGQRAKILSEVIPDLPRDFVGTVSISAENVGYLVSALTLRGAGGVYSSLPSGETARPAPHEFVIWNVFSQLRSTVAFEELIPDPHTIELEIIRGTCDQRVWPLRWHPDQPRLSRAARGFRKRTSLHHRPRTRSRVPVQDRRTILPPRQRRIGCGCMGTAAVPIVGLRSIRRCRGAGKARNGERKGRP